MNDDYFQDVQPECPICTASDATHGIVELSVDGCRVIAPARHVAAFAAMDYAESADLMARIAGVLAQMGPGAVRFVAGGTGHFHIVVQDAPHDSPPPPIPLLVTGGGNAMLNRLIDHIDGADRVDLAVAFVLRSGIALLRPYLQDLLDREGRLRIVVGDYMDVTEPAALRVLLDFKGLCEVYVFEARAGSFHPKAWVFMAKGGGEAIVGSSNLSRTALTDGVEWNLSTGPDTHQWREVAEAFDALLGHPSVRPLDPAWIDAYEARRQAHGLPDFAKEIVEESPADPVPTPHLIQQRALAALQRARDDGARAGLVVLATGLGKTWLAAFDSLPFGRVLFVAHREEILNQAMATFRRIRPEGRFGRYDGTEKNGGADVLFASIQTLGRATHLNAFTPDRFDYIVVDEFHHAAATTYRRLIDHFAPRFLLGLTATPERTDGGDLLHLCDDTLVFRCDLFEGIEEGLLCPFRYWGVPDPVDYAQIPWRGNRFDEEDLTRALATRTRAQNVLEQYRLRGAGAALGFCVSIAHARFMAGFFVEAGLRAVAVHSGDDSAPRTSSLDALARGDLDIVFAVDMFNEGVDVPAIRTVLMLRPTESTIVWLQQLGRGLRQAEGKAALAVIDYIGNHRVFLTKARALLSAPEGDRALALRLDAVLRGEAELPPGCEVTYDLEIVDILRGLLRTRDIDDDMEAFYTNFTLRHGRRPTALETAMSDFDPRAPNHGGWVEFLRHMGEPIPDLVAQGGRGLFADIIRRADRDALDWLSCAVEAGLARGVVEPFTLSLSLAASPERAAAARSYWAMSHLTEKGGLLRPARLPDDAPDTVAALLRELLEWRLAITGEETPASDTGMQEPERVAYDPHPASGLILWHSYDRPDIAPLFDAPFSRGSWNAGIVRVDNRLILLTTLKKVSLAAGNHYEDKFLDPHTLQWQSQTSTRRESRHGAILSGQEDGSEVHLFIRAMKLRNSKAAPFTYCGRVHFIDWEGERPITIRFALPEAVPRHLWTVFGIKDGRE